MQFSLEKNEQGVLANVVGNAELADTGRATSAKRSVLGAKRLDITGNMPIVDSSKALSRTRWHYPCVSGADCPGGGGLFAR